MDDTLSQAGRDKGMRERVAKVAAEKRLLRHRTLLCMKKTVAEAKRSDPARRLKKSLQLQRKLRKVAHQALQAQEDEREYLSHELQDEVGQALLGVNAQLIALKEEARGDINGLREKITSTQRLVAKSVRAVKRVARKFARK